MSVYKVGYQRKSTDKDTQKFDRQTDQLIEAGCQQIYTDTISGKSNSKPQQLQMIADLEKRVERNKAQGIEETLIVVVVSIDRLGRSTKQVITFVEKLESLGVGLTSIKEGFQAFTPQGKFFLTIVSAFAELEAGMCSERVKDGLKSAKRRGKKLGRPFKDSEKMDTAIRMWQSGDFSVAEICASVPCSKQTLYNEIGRRGIRR